MNFLKYPLPQRRRTLQEMVEDTFLANSHLRVFAGVMANHTLVLDSCATPISFEEIRKAIGRVKDQLVQNSAYHVTWTEGFEHFQDYDSDATRRAVEDALILNTWPFDGIHVEAAIRVLLRDNPSILAKSRSAMALQNDDTERDNVISELTKGGSFVVSRPDGSRQRYDTQGRPIEFSQNGMTPVHGAGRQSDPGFSGMSTSELKALYNTVMSQRQLKSMDVVDLQKFVKEQHKSGEKVWDALTGRWVLKSALDNTPTPYAELAAPVAQAADGIELVNPDTGQPIQTKLELVRFIKQDFKNTDRLIRRHGRTVPELARRFEQILNGTV